jgi:ribosome-associated protein
MIRFKLDDEYIELFKLIKTVQLAQTGGHAKLMVEEGGVILNGQQEFRKRAKIRKGDRVECGGNKIEIV